MDDAMIARLLSTYNGAQPTVKNVNAARQFFATNPEIAEKRAMGLRGSGVDDNSDIFGAQLEKFMQAAETEPPPGRVEVGQPEVVAPPTQQAAPRQAAKPASPMGPNLPMASGAVNPLDGPASATPPAGGSIWDWLLPAILGGGAIFAGDRLTRPRGEAPTKAQPRAIGEDGKLIPEEGRWDTSRRNTSRGVSDVVDLNARNLPPPNKQIAGPNQQLTGPQNAATSSNPQQLTDEISDLSRVKTNEPAPTKVTGDPGLESEGKKAQIQAEIEADNAAAKRLEDQIMKQRQSQMETKKLSDAAKRAVGRR